MLTIIKTIITIKLVLTQYVFLNIFTYWFVLTFLKIYLKRVKKID